MDYFEMLVEQRRTKNVQQIHKAVLKRWMTFLQDRGQTAALAQQADAYAFAQQELARGLKRSSVAKSLTILRGYYRFLELHGQVHENPIAGKLLPAAPVSRIQRPSDDQLASLYAWLNGQPENIAAAFYAMLGSGARVGEVAKLRADQLKLSGGAVYLVITNAKWGSDRTIPIIDPTAAQKVFAYYQKLEKPLPALLFKTSKTALERYAQKFSQEAGIHLYPHLLRHTFAAKLMEQGVDMTAIQYLLGHRNISMTAHYTNSARVNVQPIAATVYQSAGPAPLTPAAQAFVAEHAAQVGFGAGEARQQALTRPASAVAVLPPEALTAELVRPAGMRPLPRPTFWQAHRRRHPKKPAPTLDVRALVRF